MAKKKKTADEREPIRREREYVISMLQEAHRKVVNPGDLSVIDRVTIGQALQMALDGIAVGYIDD